MALSDSDCLELLKHLQAKLREADPELFDRLGVTITGYIAPYEQLRNYLFSIVSVMKGRSGVTYRRVVTQLGQYITAPDNKAIEGINITLSPMKQQLYQMDEIELARLPDNWEFINDLLELVRDLEQEWNR
jgi:hypothetical protein